VYGDNDADVAKRIKVFQSLGFVPLIDGKHGKDFQWFEETKGPNRLFVLNDDDLYLEACEVRHLPEEVRVDVMISFNEGEEVSCKDWDTISEWVEYNLKEGQGLNELDEQLLKILQRPYVAERNDRKCTDILGEAYKKEDTSDCYGFSEYLVVERKVKVYEITKPNVDRPYVTIVENYKGDDLDMFSGFFASSSWGVSNADIQFMQQLWKWKMMPGEFNCEKLVKTRVDRVVKEGEAEPRVWRNTLQNVVEIVKGWNFEKGTLKKRKGDTFLDSVKRAAFLTSPEPDEFYGYIAE
jgi:hypothetical protein